MINLSTSAFYERANRQIGDLRKQANTMQQQIGTGQRLERSSDDPVAAARLRTLARTERITAIDQRNSEAATTDLQLTDNALEAVASLVIRVKELATQAGNGTLSAEQRASIGVEVSAMGSNLLAIANTRSAAGHALFGGQSTGQAYTLSGTTVGYAGTPSVDAIDLGDGQSVQPGLTGPEVFNFTASGGPTDLFAVLNGLAAALQGGVADPAQAARDALATLDTGLEKVTTAQTVVGARMGWVEMLDDRRVSMGELVATEQQQIGGADQATTMIRLQEMLTVLDASQASFVRLANVSLFNQLR
jgi:flagellar hook-associated protein 3 FlgL